MILPTLLLTPGKVHWYIVPLSLGWTSVTVNFIESNVCLAGRLENLQYVPLMIIAGRSSVPLYVQLNSASSPKATCTSLGPSRNVMHCTEWLNRNRNKHKMLTNTIFSLSICLAIRIKLRIKRSYSGSSRFQNPQSVFWNRAQWRHRLTRSRTSSGRIVTEHAHYRFLWLLGKRGGVYSMK